MTTLASLAHRAHGQVEALLASTASPPPRGNLALTVGAAALTVAIVAGVISGPSIIACSEQGGNLLACLRDRVAAQGLLPGEPRGPAPSDAPPAQIAAEPAAPPAARPAEPGGVATQTSSPGATRPLEPSPSGPDPAPAGVAEAVPPRSTPSRPGAPAIASPATSGATAAATAPTAAAEPSPAVGGDAASPRETAASVPAAAAGGATPARAGDAGMARSDEAISPTPAVPVQPERAAGVDDRTIAQPFVSLVRVEPDGSMLLAGTAAPGAALEVWSNDVLIGTADADARGDWVFVPAASLGVGAAEVTVRVSGEDTAPPQAFAVIVHPDRSAEPLVVASVPGEVSRVLQGASRSTSTAPQPAGRTTAAPGRTGVPPAEVEAETPGAAPATTGPAAGPASPGAVEPVAPTTVADFVPPSIDAIEIDGTRNFFAGSGEERATVRVYVDNRFVDDAEVAGGRWLVEAEGILKRTAQRVRVDQLAPGTATVAARAEVNFVVSLPLDGQGDAADAEMARATEPAVAAATPVAPIAPALAPSTGAAAVPQPTATIEGREISATPATSPVGGTTAAIPSTSTGPSVEAGPAAGTPLSPAPAGAVSPQPERIAAAPEPDLTAVRREPFAESDALANLAALPPNAAGNAGGMLSPPPGDGAITTLDRMAGANSVNVTEIAVPTGPSSGEQPDVPTMVAMPQGVAGEERFVSGKAIIRRGDNLWTIARRVYGSGVKYTTIYQANEDQIRSPHRIYPGQVFDLPEAQ